MTRTIAMTGGNGFIGGYLVTLHANVGEHVRVMSRTGRRLPEWGSNVEVIRADLLKDERILPAFLDNADVLYHCAGETVDAASMQSVNVEATARLARAAAGRIGHWVQLGSIGVYGAPREGRIDETTTLQPRNAYEISKAEADRLLLDTSNAGGFACTVLRPAIVFGPRMRNNSLRQLVRAIGRGLFFFVGRPGAILPYVAVEDVAETLQWCGSRAGNGQQIYNMADNPTIEEVMQAICRGLGRRPTGIRLPETAARVIAAAGTLVPGFPLTPSRIDALTARAFYDCSKLRAGMDVRPRLSVLERLELFAQACGMGRA